MKFSLKEACSKMGFKNLVIVEQVKQSAIDCMGKKLDVNDFCDKFSNQKNFTRGYIDSDARRVICEEATGVSLSVTCEKDGAHEKVCISPEKSCHILKKLYARRLALIHSAFLDIFPGQVNCYYSTQ